MNIFNPQSLVSTHNQLLAARDELQREMNRKSHYVFAAIGVVVTFTIFYALRAPGWLYYFDALIAVVIASYNQTHRTQAAARAYDGERRARAILDKLDEVIALGRVE
jgi:hypothetical protein